MKTTTAQAGLLTLIVATAMTTVQTMPAHAQRRGRRPPATPPATQPVVEERRTIPIPAMDAYSMFQRQRVWIFTPPAGATQFGIGGLGQGARVWALLPSCQHSRDDGRDPCPVDRVAIEVITGNGNVQSVGPTELGTTPGGRRVMSFVVPLSVEICRLKILKTDGTVRYEAAVHTAALENLPNPEGRAQGTSWAFDMTRYPAN